MEELELEQNEQLLEQRRLRRLEQKRRRKMQQRLVLAVLLIIIVLSIVLIVRGCRSKNVPAPVMPAPDVPAQTEQGNTVSPDSDSVVQLAAVGDIMIYDDILAAAQQTEGVYDFSDMFSAVAAYTMGADLTVGNLELNFCGAPYSGKPDFRAPEELARTLQDVGFDVLQTANTYSIQNGMTGLSSTISALDAVGIDHLGTYASTQEREQSRGVLIKTVNGVRMAFIGFTKGLNNLTLPQGSEYAVDLLYTDYDTDYSRVAEDAILNAVRSAEAADPDIIIAMLHWGSEYDNTITDTQKKIENLLLENGVDVILGSHSHVVGRMEEKQVTTKSGEEKTCFVAYSLGNFLASQTQSGTMESALLNLEITKSGSTGETCVSAARYTPLYILKQEGAAQTTFQILPIRSAITSGLFPDAAQTLTDALAHLRANTASDYDSGK